jgi:hypothetical protein
MPKKLNNNRKYPDGTSPRPDLSKVRREEAKERQENYSKLTVEQKLAAIDAKLGMGIGAKKQRARLIAMLEKPEPKELELPEIVEDAGKKRIKAKDRRKMENKHFNEDEEFENDL